MSRSRRAGQLLNSYDEIVDAGPVGTLLPLAVVADAVDLVVEADGAADSYIGLRR